jgi:phospholipid/cholesterol/gamma-HCH transport system permease protein
MQSQKTKHSTSRPEGGAHIVVHEGKELRITLSGVLDIDGTAEVWAPAFTALKKTSGKVHVDIGEVLQLDGAGAIFLGGLRKRAEEEGRTIVFQGLEEGKERLLKLYDPGHLPEIEKPRRKHFFEKLGESAHDICKDVRELTAFTGKAAEAFARLVANPKLIRRKDLLAICEDAGADAVPIVALIGFLLGLVLAFQSAVPMKRFGADIYVADLLGLSIMRELGPLVTCIFFAGRSGSAFAAELGTMKLNEEIDALTTMGVDPAVFLMVPRVLAAMIVIPSLTAFFNLFAMIGGAVVVTSFGYPLITYYSRVVESTSVLDFSGGMFKALVFSILVAGIGCHRGMTTGQSAGAVGASTTSSVVGGLVLIALADGVLAVMYYFLGV